jgi:hypothetical protein
MLDLASSIGEHRSQAANGVCLLKISAAKADVTSLRRIRLIAAKVTMRATARRRGQDRFMASRPIVGTRESGLQNLLPGCMRQSHWSSATMTHDALE